MPSPNANPSGARAPRSLANPPVLPDSDSMKKLMESMPSAFLMRTMAAPAIAAPSANAPMSVGSAAARQ